MANFWGQKMPISNSKEKVEESREKRVVALECRALIHKLESLREAEKKTKIPEGLPAIR